MLVINSSLLAAGTFILWFGLFYYLAEPRIRGLFSLASWLMSGIVIVNYMFFGTNLGMLTPALKYEEYPIFPATEQILNLAVIFGLAVLLLLIWYKRHSFVKPVYVALGIAIIAMSAVNLVSIQSKVPEIRRTVESVSAEKASISFSKEGKNVMVIMMDRAINAYIPYIFKESPETAEQFEGFTYYPNTLTHGWATNLATPSLFGGYEYTPEELNKRDDELLEDKHNEALKVMPVLFGEEGYDVTVIDPPFAGYSIIPDLSIYDEYPYIDAYITNQGQFNIFGIIDAEGKTEDWNRNFFCFSLMKMAPLALQTTIYQTGTYLDPDRLDEIGMATAYDNAVESSDFIHAYSFMSALKECSRINEGSENNFTVMKNDLTHSPALMRLPEYDPWADINDEEFYAAYYEEHADTYNIDGRVLYMDTASQRAHYHVNLMTMKFLGEWFDYLRENDVYDNTKIIIASDHGYSVAQMDGVIFDEEVFGIYASDTMHCNPLLMVKDFNSDKFTTDNSFMTIADVPTITLQGVIDDPVNPFTGKEISNEAKNAPEQHVFISYDWNPESNNGTTFLPGIWLSVKDYVLDPGNWRRLGKY